MINKDEPTIYQSLLKQSIDRLIPVFEEQLSQTEYLLGGDTWSMADISALCSFGYHDLRINQDWKKTYPYLKSWFIKLHTIDSVKSTIPCQ